MKQRDHARPPDQKVRGALVVGALAVLAIASYLAPAVQGQGPPAPNAEGRFEGDWSATGTRQALPAGHGGKANIAYFSGSVLLNVEGGLSRGYRAEVIAYDNGKDLSVGTCVWTDGHGDQIFSEIKGQSVETGKHIMGTFTGGTGRYAGITGGFEFDWQYVIVTPEGEVQGRVSSVKGWWKKGHAPGGPSAGKTAP